MCLAGLKRCKKMSLEHKKIKLWWESRQHLFILPPLYGGHAHVWEAIDLSTLGCTICGVIHACVLGNKNVVSCKEERQADSSVVCTYTGVILRDNEMVYENISVDDYTTGTSKVPKKIYNSRKYVNIEEKSAILHEMIWGAIDRLLYSKESKMALEAEEVRYAKKIQSSFIAALHKDRYGFFRADIINCVESAIFSVYEYRKTPTVDMIPPRKHWKHLVRNIVILLLWINIPKPYYVSRGNERMFNLVVSLIYMSAHGIKQKNLIFLHKHEILHHVLPLELMLWSCFQIQSKIVTEGENIIKKSINDMCDVKRRYIQEEEHVCGFSTSHRVCVCSEHIL